MVYRLGEVIGRNRSGALGDGDLLPTMRIKPRQLALGMCRDLYVTTDGQSAWIALSRIAHRLALDPDTALYGARFAVLQQWLALEELPLARVRLRTAGRKIVARQSRRAKRIQSLFESA
jgi:hypothetical protein